MNDIPEAFEKSVLAGVLGTVGSAGYYQHIISGWIPVGAALGGFGFQSMRSFLKGYCLVLQRASGESYRAKLLDNSEEYGRARNTLLARVEPKDLKGFEALARLRESPDAQDLAEVIKEAGL